MKNAIIIAMVLLISAPVVAYRINYTVDGFAKKWPDGQIDIHLDGSLDEQYGEGTTAVIEESFLAWADHIDADIELNFVDGDCEANFTDNCVTYTTQRICKYGAAACVRSSFYPTSGEIVAVDIVLTDEVRQRDIKNVVMHEIGHFLGLSHSDNHEAIMYEHVTISQELHQDDINGIMTLYGDGTEYPSIASEPVDYHFVGCSIGNQVTTNNIFKLIF